MDFDGFVIWNKIFFSVVIIQVLCIFAFIVYMCRECKCMACP